MSLGDSLLQVTSVANQVSSGINTARNLGAALSNGLSAAGGIGSALRSIGLPIGGDATGGLSGGASASFGGDANPADWRVRLSMSSASSFQGSSVLAPLKQAGGLVFPYTPTITIKSSAKYSAISTTHTNYTFQAYQHSEPGTIEIVAPMNVEDATQGMYWIAAVHYLRSLTKMFTGPDALAGNPPPIILLNGYGNYVFQNIPVVVTSFSCTLPNDCDYISVTPPSGGGGSVGGLLGGIASVAGDIGAFGSAIPGLANAANAIGSLAGAANSAISSVSNAVGAISGLINGTGGSAATGNLSHVPTKSEFSLVLQPIYSRNSVKSFSLDKFVAGGYLGNSFGYI